MTLRYVIYGGCKIYSLNICAEIELKSFRSCFPPHPYLCDNFDMCEPSHVCDGSHSYGFLRVEESRQCVCEFCFAQKCYPNRSTRLQCWTCSPYFLVFGLYAFARLRVCQASRECCYFWVQVISNRWCYKTLSSCGPCVRERGFPPQSEIPT